MASTAISKTSESKEPDVRAGLKTESSMKTDGAGPFAGILRMQRIVGNGAVNRMIQAKLKVSTPGDRHEREADAVADQVMRMAHPGAMSISRFGAGSVSTQPIQRTCSHCEDAVQRKPLCDSCDAEVQRSAQSGSTAGRGNVASSSASAHINSARGGGQPLSGGERAFFESRFNHDFSAVRIHTGDSAAQAAESVKARAFTVGQDVVFGRGEYAPHSSAGKRLLAHELAHVIQQNGGGESTQAPTANSLSRAPVTIARAPTPPPGSKPATPARYKVSETKLPNGKVKIRVFGTVGDPILRPGLERKYPLPKNVGLPGYDRWHLVGPNAMGGEEGIVYAPKEFNIGKTAQVENVVRNARAGVVEQGGGEVYFDFTAECSVKGDYEGVEVRTLDKVTWKVGVRKAGSESVISLVNETAVPAAATAPASPAPAASVSSAAATGSKPASPAKPAAVVEVVEAGPAPAGKSGPPVEPAPAQAPKSTTVAPESAPPKSSPKAPKSGGKGPGFGGALLGFALPLVAGWVHSKAVEKRTEERAQKEGYVPYGAPSRQGLLYDIGAWFIDPANDSDKAVGIDKRFNFSVWRQRVRDTANGMRPGETLTMTWDIGKCKFDFLGRQEVDKRQIKYRKEADGKWVVQSGDASGTPNLNDIVSRDFPDSRLKAIIMNDPCSA